MEKDRPDPDNILREIVYEEERQHCGKLKIFFGYAAGVGKTYAMLKAAQELRKSGREVVIGYLEPHARPETTKIAQGLEQIPVKTAAYNGIQIKEMDLDAVLERHPETVLVDEYAHTNVNGSRHQKRYQDVEELLKAGINVYTTINVQHLESLCDIVASITGILVQERIPDSAFDRADEVQIVDIEPEDLLKRLEAGKVYRPEQAGRAMQHFFTMEKLTALRELALRRMADRVNLTTESAKRKAGGEYYTEEKILVGISSSPSNPKIIRTAARMAKAFGGMLIGLHVENRNSAQISREDQKRLKEHLRLAEQLGAKIEIVCGDDVPFLIAEYAKASGISKIVTGRSMIQAGLIRKPTFTDKLAAYAPNLDIYIIPDHQMKKGKPKLGSKTEGNHSFTVRHGGYALLCLLISTGIGFLFYEWKFSDTNIITIYILGVMVSAILTSSREISFVQSLVSVILFNFLFTEPRFSLETYDPGYPVTFAITFLAALITGTLALKMRYQAKELARSAYRTKLILDMNQMLQNKQSIEEIGNTMAEQLSKVLGRCVVFYARNGERLSAPVIFEEKGQNAPAGKEALITENEKAVAEWVFKNNKRAGATTGTLSESACYYLGIRNLETVYGVVGIEMKKGETLSAPENTVVLAVLSETATVMERELLRLKEARAMEKAGQENFRANLLRSISHDLRTPLTSICGNADMLLQGKLPEDKKEKIYGYIYEDALWLINLVENLLSVTRIDKGRIQLRQEAELLEDLIGEALKHIGRNRETHEIQVAMENEFQLVHVDSRLIVQVLINIVDNAVKYMPPGGEIRIRTRTEDKQVRVMIADQGNGISDQDKAHIFEMFYTGSGKVADSKRSLGLGLALCKTIIEAHGGSIRVYDNIPKGSVFDFTIPTEEAAIHE